MSDWDRLKQYLDKQTLSCPTSQQLRRGFSLRHIPGYPSPKFTWHHVTKIGLFRGRLCAFLLNEDVWYLQDGNWYPCSTRQHVSDQWDNRRNKPKARA